MAKKKDPLSENILVHFVRIERTKEVKVRGKNEYNTLPDVVSDVFVIFTADTPEELECRRAGLKKRGFQEAARFRLLPAGGDQVAGLQIRLPKTGIYELATEIWKGDTK